MSLKICEDYHLLSVFTFFKELIKIAGIFVPILLIILITIDLIKLVIDPSSSNIKKLENSLLSKGSATIVFFLLPIIFNVFGLINTKSECSQFFNMQSILTSKYKMEAQRKALKIEETNYMEKLEAERVNHKVFKEAKRKEKLINQKREQDNKKDIRRKAQEEKKRRNETYYNMSFPNASYFFSGEMLEKRRNCGDSCYDNGFWARFTKPTKGDKYFPELGGVLLGQCVWYAKGRAQEIIATSNLPQNEKEWRINAIYNTRGNGTDWNHNNSSLRGFKYGNIPKPGSIVSWARGQYGHVGIIEDVDGNNIILTDGQRKQYPPGSYNWRNGPYWEDVEFFRRSFTFNSLSTFAGSLHGFIYLLE